MTVSCRMWLVLAVASSIVASLTMTPRSGVARPFEDPPVRKEKSRKSGESTRAEKEQGDQTERGRGVRDDRSGRERRPDPRPPRTPPTRRPEPLLPDSSPIPRSSPTFFLTPDRGEQRALDCATALICPLDPEDDYLAWMLVRQTSIPYRGIAHARATVGDWAGALDELDVDLWELYAALGEDLPEGPDDPSDSDSIHAAVQRHLSGIRLPRFSCELPIVIEELPRTMGPPAVDSIDEIVADRIADETGWCRDDLLLAREWLGSWGRVARKLYLSPFLFEASFGIDLRIDSVGQERVARYPQDSVVRDVADRGAWPEVTGR